jgi:sugar O-acyltransferase (sialic acid O-acetyltransferase NeuD family)
VKKAPQSFVDRKKLVILGAGGFAEDAFELASSVPGVVVEAFVEGLDKSRCRDTLRGLPIVWIEDVSSLGPEVRSVCAVGSTKRRRFIEEAASLGVKFTSLVHPSAVVPESVTIGEGTIVGPGVVIAANTQIGNHVLVNRGVLLGHHVEVGDYATLGPGSNVGAYTRIGAQTYVGLGARIVDRITIGDQAGIGAGSLVIREVPPNTLVVGAPAETLRSIPEGL